MASQLVACHPGGGHGRGRSQGDGHSLDQCEGTGGFRQRRIPNTENPDDDNDGVRDEWDDDDNNDGVINSTDRDYDFNYILQKSSSDNISSSSQRFFVRAGYFLGQMIVILLL